MVLLVVWLARRVRRRLKQTEFERLDGESEEIWWRKWVDWAPLSSLAGAFSQGQGLMQGQEANRDSMEEDQEGGERRPLLE